MVRDATPDDVQAMVRLGQAMHAESRYAAFNFDPIKLASEIEALIEQEDGFALVAERNGEVVGAFIGYVGTHYFGNDRVAMDLALIVAPSERASMLGVQLVKRYIQQAKAKGVADIVLSNSTGVDSNRVADLFERLGFQRQGFVFSMRAGQ